MLTVTGVPDSPSHVLTVATFPKLPKAYAFCGCCPKLPKVHAHCGWFSCQISVFSVWDTVAAFS